MCSAFIQPSNQHCYTVGRSGCRYRLTWRGSLGEYFFEMSLCVLEKKNAFPLQRLLHPWERLYLDHTVELPAALMFITENCKWENYHVLLLALLPSLCHALWNPCFNSTAWLCETKRCYRSALAKQKRHMAIKRFSAPFRGHAKCFCIVVNRCSTLLVL